MIRSRMQEPGVFPLVVVLDRLKPTFNIGKILRTANAFGVREVHIVGTPIFNHRPSRGALRHTKTRMFDHFDESHSVLIGEGYQLVGLDPTGSDRLGTWTFPERTALVIGHEEYGLSFDPARYPGMVTLQIPQFGRMQSLNASIAASIACFEYIRQRSFA